MHKLILMMHNLCNKLIVYKMADPNFKQLNHYDSVADYSIALTMHHGFAKVAD